MQTITYYLTRDTNCSGDLSCEVKAWYRKPIRVKLRFEKGFTWLPAKPPAEYPEPKDLGLYGGYTLEQARACFKTIPDTDLEMIKCIQDQKQESKP